MILYSGMINKNRLRSVIGRLRKYVVTHKATILSLSVIIACVLVANGFHLLRMADPNPTARWSKLAISSNPGPVGTNDTIDPNNGFISQAMGHLAAQKWLHGDIPYWDSYMGIGVPLGGDMQSGALFFPFILLMNFPNGLLYLHITLEIIAGIATYLLLRRLKVHRVAAVCLGVAFALNGVFAWLQNAIVNPIAFLPLLLLGAEIALSRAKQNRRGGWAIIALALAFSLYAGFPEVTFLNSLFAGGWILVRMVGVDRDVKKRYILKIIWGCLSGLLLSAPILVAFGMYMTDSYIGAHKNVFADVHYPARYFPQVTMPYIYGPVFRFQDIDKTNSLLSIWMSTGGFITMSSVVLAFFGLTAKKMQLALKIFVAGFLAVCLMKLIGHPHIATTLLNMIPGMKAIAFHRYVIDVLSFGVVILAAFGLDSILTGKIKMKRAALTTFAAVLFLGMMVLMAKNLMHLLESAPHYQIWAWGSIGFAALTVAVVCSGALFPKKKLLVGAACAMVVVDSVFMFFVPTLATPKTEIDMTPVNYLRQNLGLQRYYTTGPIYPNYGSYFGIASVNYTDLPIPDVWAQYVHKNMDTNTQAGQFTPERADPSGPDTASEFLSHIENYKKVGVKYVVTSSVGQLPSELVVSERLTLVHQSPAAAIYALPDVAGYYSFDDSGCRILSQTRDKVEVDCPQQSVLTRRELSMDGWRAAVNGKHTGISTKDTIFQAVAVPSGKSTVTFSYDPPYIKLSYIAFFAGTAMLVFGVAGDKIGLSKIPWPKVGYRTTDKEAAITKRKDQKPK